MYHKPVLLDESVNGLAISEGTYVDVTFGGGGHSKLILEQMGESSQLFGFDQDADALTNQPDDERFTLIHHNFRHLKNFLRLEGCKEVDGLLADLGVSSHQFDTGDRGFSFRFDAELDMRMNQNESQTAADILNDYNAEELQNIFSRYGEVRNAKTLALKIIETRKQRPFRLISDFLDLLGPLVRGKRNRYLSQVFQALRMEVNDEEQALKDMLQQAAEVIKPGGRLVVITYHSIEDRIVKNFIKKGVFEGEPEKDIYGRFYQPFKPVNRKAIEPSAEEIELNPRSRSARLRIATRLAD